MKRGNSRSEIYLHFIWATHMWLPLIAEEIERPVQRCIQQQVRKLGCTVLALNSTADHVHLLAQVASTVSAAELAKQVNGASSRFVNDTFPLHAGFAWQEGYGAFSVSRSHVKRVTEYIENQKQRHSEDNLWPEWEETTFDDPPRPQDDRPQASQAGISMPAPPGAPPGGPAR
jgi:putative transposase